MEISGKMWFGLHLFSYHLLFKDKYFFLHLDNLGNFPLAIIISNGHLWVENSDNVDFFLINSRI